MANLIGKNILIVDEVDDTRTTLEYAVRELEKDVHQAQKELGREDEKTTFSIFVLHVSVGRVLLHVPIWFAGRDYPWDRENTNQVWNEQNKDKQKKGVLPPAMLNENRYLTAVNTGDVWICYPWEATYVPLPFQYPS